MSSLKSINEARGGTLCTVGDFVIPILKGTYRETYERIYSAFYEWTSQYSEEEQQKMFYGTAEQFYGF